MRSIICFHHHDPSDAASPRISCQQWRAGLGHAVLRLQAVLQEKLRRPLHGHAHPSVLLVLIPGTARATGVKAVCGQQRSKAGESDKHSHTPCCPQEEAPQQGSASSPGLALQPLAHLFSHQATEHVYCPAYDTNVERLTCKLQYILSGTGRRCMQRNMD